MIKCTEQTVFCNKCGKIICQDRKFNNKDFLSINKVWGYFSGKDCEMHQFNLCEECYDEMVKDFILPIKITENTEVL